MRSQSQWDGRHAGKLMPAGILMFLCFVVELLHRQWLVGLLCGVMTILIFALSASFIRHRAHHWPKHSTRFGLLIIGTLVCILALVFMLAHFQKR